MRPELNAISRRVFFVTVVFAVLGVLAIYLSSGSYGFADLLKLFGWYAAEQWQQNYLFIGLSLLTIVACIAWLGVSFWFGSAYRKQRRAGALPEREVGAIEDKSLIERVNARLAPFLSERGGDRLVDGILGALIDVGGSRLVFSPGSGTGDVRVQFAVGMQVFDLAPMPMAPYDALIGQVCMVAGLEPGTKGASQIEVRSGAQVDTFAVRLRDAGARPELHLEVSARQGFSLTLDDIPFAEGQRQRLADALKARRGLVLCGGPTGSALSSTVYAAAHYAAEHLAQSAAALGAVASIEPSIGLAVPFMHQVEVGTANAPLVFDALAGQSGRRVFVVTSVDNSEMAERAVAAAGDRLVIARVHAGTPLGALSKLARWTSVSKVSEVLLLAVGQQLSPQLCGTCRRAGEVKADALHPRIKKQSQLPSRITLYQPNGCERCGASGYHGVAPIVVTYSRAAWLEAASRASGDVAAIERMVASEGAEPFIEPAWSAARSGRITLAQANKLMEAR